MGPLEWVRSQFGATIDLRSGKEELTVSAVSLVEGLVKGFSRAGVANAISFIIDKKVVYLDANDVDHDLALIGKAAEESGILDKRFKEMHLVLAHREAGLHTIIDVRIKNDVLLGENEMLIVLSARIESLRIQPGEEAQAYAERLRLVAAEEHALEAHRHSLDALTQRISDYLRGALVGARVVAEPARIELIRPGPEQIARFRQLGFGDDVEDPAYRPVPTMQRHGAYADPYYYYYRDPYYDFMSFMLVSSMISGMAWHSPHVYVVDPSGAPLFTGADASAHAGDAWAGADAVSFNADGGVNVDPSIPDASMSDGGHSGADAGGSWGSDSMDYGSGGHDGGSSCSSSSCSGSSCSSSSCGSSCGGSSCGSSCGGG
jgi:hypothetical protein